MKAAFEYDPETIRKVLGVPSDFSFRKEDPIRSITTVSGLAEPGSIFVPLRGNRDGHEFIKDALNRGASYFLAERNHPIVESLPESDRVKAIPVKDTLLALGKLAGFHRSRFRPTIIAVTGSSGKTTTKEILGSCLSPLANNLVVTEKNYNNEIGVPFTLFRIGPQTRFVVCEMGMNHKGEIARLTEMARPDYSLITTVGTAHIELLGSQKEIAKAKAEILDGMEKPGILFYPETGDYKNLLRRRSNKQGVRFKTVPMERRIEILKKNPSGFSISYLGEILEWNLPGTKLLENLALCVSLLEEIGTPTDWIQNGIRNFKTLDKRLDFQDGNYKILNDTYNANRESMFSSLEACSQLSGEKGFYAVLGDLKEVGKFAKKFHYEIGSFAGSIPNCMGIYLFGSSSQSTLAGFQKKAGKTRPAHWFPGDEEGLKQLLETVKNEVPKGSYILAKASRGMRLERVVEGLNSSLRTDV
ncbi:UDP-N-acetylmuramoyl-tripeptide--D-alanyl-D-alanine ligase [Leptospira wolffii]|uniref:UDP-N-acetylmuramoyl-tripeptide--D-alanyl-D- alanine ligase n=1 Tax=Leptospira wolffii TaxID=409998 RepID=UPI00035325C8|nr:UDP-N-acetylmuramoyl-tripeptide--D-alanyl-D-alanine ligase [Leptospira wolffii]EPG64483.1 UDP-N-acetylmuramoyl-tripeptide--D-alanyl-D-alanine ligase [Leptospira wolffii serovar Khorat str. Khorat-H2]